MKQISSANIIKKQTFLLIALLTLTFGTTFAHQDFWIKRDFGNVKIRIATGFDYEEIKKTLIIGQLAENLSKQMNYKDQLFLDFSHNYVEKCKLKYFISFDKGSIQSSSPDNWDEPLFKSEVIILRQVGKTFDINSTLKLLEYSITNVSELSSIQDTVSYENSYCNWETLLTIDTSLIMNELKNPNSPLLNSVLKIKVDRPEEEFKYGTSYYWKENEFHIYFRDYNKSDTAILTLKNIYQFVRIDNYYTVIFDSDSSFYQVNQYTQTKISKRQIIKNTNDYFEPFKIEGIGGDKISIYFWYYTKQQGLQPKTRTLIYQAEKDKLTQDLDKLINRN